MGARLSRRVYLIDGRAVRGLLVSAAPADSGAGQGNVTVFGCAGLWMMFRKNRLVAWLMLITWLTFPDVYYVLQFIARYRTPMDWQLLLCAALPFLAVYEAVFRRRQETTRDIPAAV